MNKKLIIISGPTATGKTALSISIAKNLETHNQIACIINFDSLLFYKELSIGTAKPTEDEKANVEHQLIDICSINSPMTSADFIKLATVQIELAFSENKIPILVGGSGFYLRALIKGMYQTTEVPELIKTEIMTEYNLNGITSFWEELRTKDHKSYQKLHVNDHYRILRAIEYFRTTGAAISEERDRLDSNNPYDFEDQTHHGWNLLHIYLDVEKKTHSKIIEHRTKKMIEAGLVDEVSALLQQGFSGLEKPLQSIGYKETLNYLNGSIKTLNDLEERINISTRQLAKSQRTFFNKISNKKTYNPITDNCEALKTCLEFVTTNK